MQPATVRSVGIRPNRAIKMMIQHFTAKTRPIKETEDEWRYLLGLGGSLLGSGSGSTRGALH